MYLKQAFDAMSFAHAKDIVLSPDPSNPDKFEQETTFFVETLAQLNLINSESTVQDFGCGMGRISRELIRKFNCSVIGTDISESMRRFAMLYVSNPFKFKTELFYNNTNTIDVCIACLVLQHVENPKHEIETLVSNLKPGGSLILLNENIRFVPSGVDRNNYVVWNDDSFDVFGELEKHLKQTHKIPYCNSTHSIFVYQK